METVFSGDYQDQPDRKPIAMLMFTFLTGCLDTVKQLSILAKMKIFIQTSGKRSTEQNYTLCIYRHLGKVKNVDSILVPVTWRIQKLSFVWSGKFKISFEQSKNK